MTDRLPPRSQAIEDLLIDNMRAHLTKRPWWRTLHGRVAIVIAGLSVVAVSAAGVRMLTAEPVTEPAIVHCFEKAEIRNDGTYAGSAATVGNGTGQVTIDNAVQLCENMWQQGVMDSKRDPLSTEPAEEQQIPPSFTVCVMKDGGAAVIPGEIECSVLGLHPFSH